MRAALAMTLAACAAAEAAPPPDAGPAPRFATTITPDGVGPITARTDPARLRRLFPGLELVRRHDEGEDHAFDELTLSRGGRAALRVIVDEFKSSSQPFRVDVFDPMFTTPTGLSVASTVAEVAAALPDLGCRYARFADNPEHFDRALSCRSARLPRISFELDPRGFRGPEGKVEVAAFADRTFARIIWMPPGH
jgi:hypothetical protein